MRGLFIKQFTYIDINTARNLSLVSDLLDPLVSASEMEIDVGRQLADGQDKGEPIAVPKNRPRSVVPSFT